MTDTTDTGEPTSPELPAEQQRNYFAGQNKEALQGMCRDLGLPTKGNKDELTDRLTDHYAPLETLTNAKLIERLQAHNDEYGTNLSLTGNKDERIARLREAQAEQETQDAAEGAQESPDGAGASNVTSVDAEAQAEPQSTTEASDVVDFTPDPVVDQSAKYGAATIGEMTGPDGQSLPQTKPEPADVAGPSGGQGDGTDNSDIARAASRAADARYYIDGNLPQAGTERTTEANPTLEDEAPYYTEHTVPVADRNAEQIRTWAAAHPDATVIPPTLLPPAYQDATIATPGLPPL